MISVDGALIYSPTDLNNFIACEHLTSLERSVALRQQKSPRVENPQADILRRLGEEHEERYRAQLVESRQELVTIDRGEGIDGIRAAAEATEAAMRAGRANIYQAAFVHDGWIGYADFVRRVEEPSELGGWSYEVADTKLARRSEPYFILQLCGYSEHVGRIQGRLPTSMHVILGDGKEESFEVRDFYAHFNAVRRRFLAAASVSSEPSEPYPVKHCDLCHWQTQCENYWTSVDHLSVVASIRRQQVNRLKSSGIETLRALGTAVPDDRPPVMVKKTFDRLHTQARLQDEQRIGLAATPPGDYLYELPAPDLQETDVRGLAALPALDAGDVFFDMEGDPYFNESGQWFGEQSGLEYLFGTCAREPDSFVPFWGCDRSAATPPKHRLAEKRAFEAFVDFLLERRARFSNFHVYHYAAYEKTALLRLAQAHSTRETEVDELFREGRFVDLYRIVGQALMVGQPSYGLKSLEAFYERVQRSGVKKGDDSIVEFERWLIGRSGRAERDEAILEDIEQYNRFDCFSTLHLLDWLHELRSTIPEGWLAPAAAAAAKAEPTLTPRQISARERAQAFRDEIDAMVARLRVELPPDFVAERAGALEPRQRLAWILSELLQYHQREEKPKWWEFHDTCERFADDPHAIVDDGSAIGGLEVVEIRADGSIVLSFPDQPHKISAGKVYDLADRLPCGDIVEVDEVAHQLVFVPKGGRVAPRAIVAMDEPPTDPLIRSMLRTCAVFLSTRGRDPLPGAVFNVLQRGRPQLHGARVESLQPDRPDGASILPVVQRMDATHLFIQGPPGSGKTEVGAELILALLRAKKRVGIAAPSHKAAHNLLDRIGRFALERKLRFRAIHKSSKDKPGTEYHPAPESDGGFVENTSGSPKAFDPGVLYSGTPWLFASESAADQFDYIFVDEAGQVSLAAFVALAPAAKNVVFLGDPQQLSHVSMTSHPGDVGISVLEFLLDGQPVVDEQHGIFLNETRRMHRDVCRFISETSYRGKLHEIPACNLQTVIGSRLAGSGLRYMPIVHEGCKAASPLEAERIADEIAELLNGGELVDRDGVRRAIQPDDIIVVSPYNVQRKLLERTIFAKCRRHVEVGTVDKFQGREAYVVFYSMATSSGDDMPRNTAFLLDRNRLNVAISRARAMAVLVCSPALSEVATTSIDAMRLVNGLDRFIEMAVPA